MDTKREKLYKDLFTSLKIAFKNASIYNMEHPAFVKAVESLKHDLDAIFPLLNPIILSFTPRSIFLDGTYWENEKIYVELGKLFHFRKIKTIELKSGITYEELMRFASKLTLSLKAFLRAGGASNILEQERIRHITVEELDYSLLLKGEGEEVNDVWEYLLQEAVAEADESKIEQVTGSFGTVIKGFNTEDLIKNEEMHKNFEQFFDYLKENEDKQYRRCAKDLIKAVVTNKKITTESKFENLKLLISDLKEEDLASTLWEEILIDDDFDTISFSIFSKLMEKNRHEKICTSLTDLFHSDDSRNRNPEVKEKIQNLLAGTSSKFTSEIYRKTLTFLLNDITFDEKLTFNQLHLDRNFRFSLLNMLEKLTAIEDITELLQLIHNEEEKIAQYEDYEFLKFLDEVLNQKSALFPENAEIIKSREYISYFFERAILRGESSLEFDIFLDNRKKSLFDVNMYIDKIFTEKRVSPYLLRSYFTFFTEYIFYLILNLEQKKSDIKFSEKVIDCLQLIDSPITLVVLKGMYSSCPAAIKFKILKAMHHLSEIDEKFLLPILKTKDMSMKGEALVLLMRSDNYRTEALDKLLNIQSPYGLKNKRLLAHLTIVDSNNLKEAEEYLKILSKRKGFWNKKIRIRANEIQERWHAG